MLVLGDLMDSVMQAMHLRGLSCRSMHPLGPVSLMEHVYEQANWQAPSVHGLASWRLPLG